MLLLLLACAEPPAPEPPPEAPVAPSPVPVRVLELGPDALSTPEGSLHGGDLVSGGVLTEARAWLGAGTWTVGVQAAATDVGGEPGRLALSLDGAPAGTLEVLPGQPPQGYTTTLEVPDSGTHELTLRFTNDHFGADGDRNVTLSRWWVEATRPEDTEARLREELAGKNLLLVSLDTVRADHLSTYGYARETSPFLTKLAAAGVRFDRAVPASHWTAPSHATLFTGLHAPEHGVEPSEPVALPAVPTLAEHLGGQGYRTAAFTGSFLVSELLGFDRGFADWWEQPTDCQPAVEAAQRWLAEAEGPWFVFFHTYQAHQPYLPPPEHDVFVPPGSIPERVVDGMLEPGERPTTRELEVLRGRYDGDLRAADACLAELVSAVDRDETLIVVTSDHGEELWEYGGSGHGRLLPVTLHVPLVVSHPSLRWLGAGKVEAVVGAVDVPVTVLDALGVPPLPGASGQSRFSALVDGERGGQAFAASRVRGRHVATRVPEALWVAEGRPRLYLEAEPTVDRAQDPPLDTLPLQEAATAWFRGLEPREDNDAIDFSDEAREALQALGYLDE